MIAAIDMMELSDSAVHVIHVLAALVAGGAILFQALALHPTLRSLDESTQSAASNTLADRWRPVAFVLIAILLITGLVTFGLRIPVLRENPQKMVYHGLFGVKFLLALVIFHGVAVLALPGAKGERYRATAGKRLPLLAALVVAIVILAGILRSISG